VLLALGCASSPELTPATRLELEAEIGEVGSQLFAEMIDEKVRLLDIEYALNHTAAKACGDLVRPQFGILTGSLVSLDQTWLKEASAKRGILGDGLNIVHVVPGSPFERAGLRAGDELLSVNGESPRSHSDLHAQRMRATDLAPTVVRYRREGREYSIEIPTHLACPVTFSLFQSEALVTTSRRAQVLVPRGLLASARDEHVLAIALAHGFAHAVWDKPGSSRLEQEQRADRLGTRLAAHAGFDVSKTIGYWEDVARVHPWLVLPDLADVKFSITDGFDYLLEMIAASSHNGIAVRMEGLRVAVEAGASRR
jgi:hypothetical protein